MTPDGNARRRAADTDKVVPASSLREFRKFSRGGIEKTANGIG
jgi:hypothetical protein